MPTAMIEKPAITAKRPPKPRVKSDKSLILLLGALGGVPGVLISFLSSAFIDNVLVRKYFDRALPIILCFMVLKAMDFALNYNYWRVQTLNRDTLERIGSKYYQARVKTFSALLNALFIFLLEPYIVLFLGIMLAVIFASFNVQTRLLRKDITYEGRSTIRTILRVSALFLGGLFVMRGRITLGEFYAVNTLSNVVFSRTLSLMPQRAKKEAHPQAEKFESVSKNEPRSLKVDTMAREILKDKKVIFLTVFLAVAGTFSQNIYMSLQRINMSDSIPAGDWSNLLLNCIFMCAFTVCGYFAKKGNQAGFIQLFHNRVPVFFEKYLGRLADLTFMVIFGIYYSFQIRQYNALLASRTLLGCLIAGAVLFMLLLSGKRRRLWGENLGRLSEMLANLSSSIVTVYLYCVLALQITTISIGDLFVFSVAFDGLFLAIRALLQMFVIYIFARKEEESQSALT